MVLAGDGRGQLQLLVQVLLEVPDLLLLSAARLATASGHRLLLAEPRAGLAHGERGSGRRAAESGQARVEVLSLEVALVSGKRARRHHRRSAPDGHLSRAHLLLLLLLVLVLLLLVLLVLVLVEGGCSHERHRVAAQSRMHRAQLREHARRRVLGQHRVLVHGHGRHGRRGQRRMLHLAVRARSRERVLTGSGSSGGR